MQPTDTVVVRAATPADTPDTARVWQAGWLDGHLGHVPDALLAERGPAYFVDRAAALTSATLLATEVSAVVGVVIVADDELVQLAVDPQARRRGAGAALLRAAEERIGRAHTRAWLAVVPGNTRARAFYEQHGWVDAGPRLHPAPGANGPVPVPVHRYERQLA